MHWQFFLHMFTELHYDMRFCYKMGKTARETRDLLKVNLVTKHGTDQHCEWHNISKVAVNCGKDACPSPIHITS